MEPNCPSNPQEPDAPEVPYPSEADLDRDFAVFDLMADIPDFGPIPRPVKLDWTSRIDGYAEGLTPSYADLTSETGDTE